MNWAREESALSKVMGSKVSYNPGLCLGLESFPQAMEPAQGSLTDHTRGCHFLSQFTPKVPKKRHPLMSGCV